MRFPRFLRSAARVTALLIAAACAVPTETPVPVAEAESELLGLPVLTKAMTWDTPLANDIVVTKTIGSAGGVIEIKQTGMTLVVPKGAVSSNTTFTATAVKGSVVAYEFAPHGIVFSKSLSFSQALAPTQFNGGGLLSQVYGGYFTDRGLIDQVLHTVLTIELIPAVLDPGKSAVKFPIKHFSGYMVSAG